MKLLVIITALGRLAGSGVIGLVMLQGGDTTRRGHTASRRDTTVLGNRDHTALGSEDRTALGSGDRTALGSAYRTALVVETAQLWAEATTQLLAQPFLFNIKVTRYLAILFNLGFLLLYRDEL